MKIKSYKTFIIYNNSSNRISYAYNDVNINDYFVLNAGETLEFYSPEDVFIFSDKSCIAIIEEEPYYSDIYFKVTIKD